MFSNTRNIIYISLYSIIIAICSWIYIPGVIPVTMQTFAIFMAFLMLGGEKALCSIVLYIFIGAFGVPVFSGVSGGIGVILGPSGGYIIGFIFSAVTYILFSRFFKNPSFLFNGLILLISLLVCYIFGCAWYILFYSQTENFFNIIKICVLFFIPFDIIKVILALIVSNRIKCLLHYD